MQAPKIIYAFLSLTVLIYSCKKENKDETSAIKIYPNYTQLKVGNYWIYQEFNLDSAGNAMATNKYDSNYVEKDTLINGQTYYKYYSTSSIFNPNLASYVYYRDSLHYLITSDGNIIFSSQDFATVFDTYYITVPDTVCRVSRQMDDKDTFITVPAGTFKTANAKTTFSMYPNWAYNGNPRFLNFQFAENIGIIAETLPFYVSNPGYTEKRLVRYHLN